MQILQSCICGVALSLLTLNVTSAEIQTIQKPTLELVSKKRSGRTVFDYTFKATFTNTGADVKAVTGVLTSMSIDIQVIDGNVNIGGLLQDQSTEIVEDTITLRVDRRKQFNPNALIWTFDGELSGPFISVESSPSEQTVTSGDPINIVTGLSFISPNSGSPFTVSIDQKITPDQEGGFVPEYSGTNYPNLLDNFSTVLNQEVFLETPGQYTVTTTATINQTGETATHSSVVNVIDDNTIDLKAYLPGIEPAVLSINEGATPVNFTVKIGGKDNDKVESVVIINTQTQQEFSLNDDGVDGDFLPKDFRYSGEHPIAGNLHQSGDCSSYIARVTYAGQSVDSEPEKLCFTKYPTTLVSSGQKNIFQDGFQSEEGMIVSKDVIKVIFHEGVAEDAIDEFIASLGATIIGSKLDFGIYQVKLNKKSNSLIDLISYLSEIEDSPIVKSLDVEYLVKMTQNSDSNTSLSNKAYHIQKVRADEAWYISKGEGVSIAVIDTGVDLNHPSLNENLLAGYDFVNMDNEPDDDASSSHGTHVAGIIAAVLKNGVSGLAPKSQIIPLKVLDKDGSGKLDDIIQGIEYASNRAQIINLSLGWSLFDGDGFFGGYCILKNRFGFEIKTDSYCHVDLNSQTEQDISEYCTAVEKAYKKGVLVVAAAGNDGTTLKSYPAGCSYALAIANTKENDERYKGILSSSIGGSNYGNWIDLAAPGTDIFSTVRGGVGSRTGTSMAAPIVSAAAALLMASDKALYDNPDKVIDRLKRTANKLPGEQLGAGRIDVFEALFNGSFEEGNLARWEKSGSVASIDALEDLVPQHRERMGYISTGPAGTETAGSLTQSFNIQEGVTELPITITYTFISEEYPEYVGSSFNDSLVIKVVSPNGEETVIAEESVNSASFSTLNNSLDFPGGDNTLGWTKWKTISKKVPVTEGTGTYKIILEDAGDTVYDTVLLIDNIEFVYRN